MSSNCHDQWTRNLDILTNGIYHLCLQVALLTGRFASMPVDCVTRVFKALTTNSDLQVYYRTIFHHIHSYPTPTSVRRMSLCLVRPLTTILGDNNAVDFGDNDDDGGTPYTKVVGNLTGYYNDQTPSLRAFRSVFGNLYIALVNRVSGVSAWGAHALDLKTKLPYAGYRDAKKAISIVHAANIVCGDLRLLIMAIHARRLRFGCGVQCGLPSV